jgi:hypothetical protein
MTLLLSEIIASGIQKTDDDGTLQIYCAKDPDTKFKRSIRGTIFEGEKLIYRGFPYTEEVIDVEKIKQYELQKFRCCWSYEGTLLKFFYHEVKGWYATTHRKLDAFKSKWVSKKTFGELFEEALTNYNLNYTEFLNGLDKTKRYHVMLISNADTRIVVRPELQNELLYLVLVTDNTDVPVWPACWNFKIPVSKPVEINSPEHIVELAENINPFEKQGLIFFNDDFTKQYRVLNSRYRDYSNVRNNIANLKYCYVEARRNKDTKAKFLEMYPEVEEMTKFYEERIKVIAQELYQVYKQRYIQQQMVKTSHERHDILKTIHSYYLETRAPVKLDDVERIINNFNRPNKIYKIISRNETFQTPT